VRSIQLAREIEQMHFEQRRAASTTVGRTPRLATAGSGCSASPITSTTKIPRARVDCA
jgi:hypothetical protein